MRVTQLKHPNFSVTPLLDREWDAAAYDGILESLRYGREIPSGNYCDDVSDPVPIEQDLRHRIPARIAKQPAAKHPPIPRDSIVPDRTIPYAPIHEPMFETEWIVDYGMRHQIKATDRRTFEMRHRLYNEIGPPYWVGPATKSYKLEHFPANGWIECRA